MEVAENTKASWSTPLAGVQQKLLGAHFLLLTRLLRQSARSDFAPFEPQNLMERRIVLTLFGVEEGRVSQLAAMLGNDLAQVSRALTSMRTAGLITRGRQRDPYELTSTGLELGESLNAVAIQRERLLTAGLTPQQMFDLAGLMTNLLKNASSLLVEEEAHARGSDGLANAHGVSEATEIHSRIEPAILNLSTTIARSATLAFKRSTGLSNYEWRILANIADRPSISFMELVIHVDSDKAQVSRALNPMVRKDLLSRRRSGRNDTARFTMTEKGRRLHDIMRQDSLRRNSLLVANLKTQQRRRLQAYLDLLITNAAGMAGRLD